MLNDNYVYIALKYHFKHRTTELLNSQYYYAGIFYLFRSLSFSGVEDEEKKEEEKTEAEQSHTLVQIFGSI